MDDENWQRLKNLAIFKIPYTDAEMDEVFSSPSFGIAIMIVLAIGLVVGAILIFKN